MTFKEILSMLLLICISYSFQIIKSLRFCKIERTDHVPSAHAIRLILPLKCNANEVRHTIQYEGINGFRRRSFVS